MSFVTPAEHDEVACTLATLLLADSGVNVDVAGIEKVGDDLFADYALGAQGYQYHC